MKDTGWGEEEKKPSVGRISLQYHTKSLQCVCYLGSFLDCVLVKTQSRMVELWDLLMSRPIRGIEICPSRFQLGFANLSRKPCVGCRLWVRSFLQQGRVWLVGFDILVCLSSVAHSPIRGVKITPLLNKNKKINIDK